MSAPRNTVGHALVKGAKWLDGFANFFGAIVKGFYSIPGTRPLKTLLHGTWPLKHPLHPAVTDLTVGGYIVSVALDVYYLVTNDAGLMRATDFVLVLTLISSVVAILTGLTDWNETFGEERRTGMLHGLLMVVVNSASSSRCGCASAEDPICACRPSRYPSSRWWSCWWRPISAERWSSATAPR